MVKYEEWKSIRLARNLPMKFFDMYINDSRIHITLVAKGTSGGSRLIERVPSVKPWELETIREQIELQEQSRDSIQVTDKKSKKLKKKYVKEIKVLRNKIKNTFEIQAEDIVQIKIKKRLTNCSIRIESTPTVGFLGMQKKNVRSYNFHKRAYEDVKKILFDYYPYKVKEK